MYKPRFYFRTTTVRSLISIFSVAVALTLLTSSDCDALKMKSKWLEGEVSVDGVRTEWKDAATYLEKDDVAVGLLNDETHLYVALITGRSDLERQLQMRGFTLWLDSKGGKKKSFGIQYPLGMMAMREGMQRDSESKSGERPDYQEMRKKSLASLDIIGPEKDERQRFAVDETEGIEVAFANSDGMFVYEIKVPLVRSEQYPYAAGTEKTGKIGLGLETTPIDQDAMRKKMGQRGGGRGGGMGGGGRGGGGYPGGGGDMGSGFPRGSEMPGGGSGGGGRGPGGGGGRGPGGGQRPSDTKPLKIWISAELAESNGE
ncbi:hypothetical protein ACFLU6_11600 [Acidobacteriota bacterium]